jgi:NDP-sugar pyrophosphorylase family protein
MYAIILAAGKGVRAWPVTDGAPKSMVPIAGKPFLEHQINWLKSGGVTDVIIDEGHKAHEISHYFRDGSKFGVSIVHYINSDLSSGAVGHIKKCLQQIPDNADNQDVIIMAGDVLTNADLPSFIAVHRERALPMTLFGKELQLALGVVAADNDNHIISIHEKPTIETGYVNTSIGIVQRNIEGYLPMKGHNFWGETLRVFQGTIYTEPQVAWWHITDISDAYRMDEELTNLNKSQDLEQQAHQYDELAQYARRQAQQLRGIGPRGRGKERM